MAEPFLIVFNLPATLVGNHTQVGFGWTYLAGKASACGIFRPAKKWLMIRK